MSIGSIVGQVDKLRTNIEELRKKLKDEDNFYIEKKKLYDYLGRDLVDKFKKHNVIIAGGAIVSIFTNREINDIDIYFKNRKHLAAFVEDVYNQNIYSHTKKATMMSHTVKDENRNEENKIVRIQMIHFKFFKNVNDIFNSFDFTAVMGAYDFNDERFYLHPDFLKHNSQRILKFNSNTDYPLISMIRVKKYEDKGYAISKPELFKIMLSAMDLGIKSYEELKDHLGGMYGVNYDELFEEIDEGEEFSIEVAISHLDTIHEKIKYYNKNCVSDFDFDNVDELINSMCNYQPTQYKCGDKYLLLRADHHVCKTSKDKFDDVEEIYSIDRPETKRVYKFVRKTDDGRYYSYYDSSFEYVIGTYVEAKNHVGLFFNELDTIGASTYSGKTDKALIEAVVNLSDIIEDGNSPKYSKCFVVREVPEKEWTHLLKDEKGD